MAIEPQTGPGGLPENINVPSKELTEAMVDVNEANITPNVTELEDGSAIIGEIQEETLEIMTQQSMRQVRWVRNKLPKVAKDLDKKIQKIRKEVEAEVIEEIKKDKRYRLKEFFLKRGVMLDENNKAHLHLKV